jgi:hypothetical protein
MGWAREGRGRVLYRRALKRRGAALPERAGGKGPPLSAAPTP